MTSTQPDAPNLARLTRAFLDLIFPPRCVGCGHSGAWLCPACVDGILFYEPPWPQLLHELHPLQQARAAAHLEGPLRQAIHAFKYEGLRALASTLGEILYDCWEADPWPADAIVPVPLHPERLRQRGYNQSWLLARELSLRVGLPIVEGTLVRKLPTPPQVGLDADQRASNVDGAFSCHDERLMGRQVLLIDDVLTTGATLRACARAALHGGADAVWAMTLAHD
jgi:ComF family protein